MAPALAEVRGSALQHFRFVPISQQPPTGLPVGTEFARCIRDKRAYPIGIDDILHGMVVFDAAVASAKTGGIVEVAA